MTKTWRNSKYTFLSERSQSEKATWFQLYEILEKVQLQ